MLYNFLIMITLLIFTTISQANGNGNGNPSTFSSNLYPSHKLLPRANQEIMEIIPTPPSTSHYLYLEDKRLLDLSQKYELIPYGEIRAHSSIIKNPTDLSLSGEIAQQLFTALQTASSSMATLSEINVTGLTCLYGEIGKLCSFLQIIGPERQQRVVIVIGTMANDIILAMQEIGESTYSTINYPDQSDTKISLGLHGETITCKQQSEIAPQALCYSSISPDE